MATNNPLLNSPSGFEIIGDKERETLSKARITKYFTLERNKFIELLRDTMKEIEELETNNKSILGYFELYQKKIPYLEKFRNEVLKKDLTSKQIYYMILCIHGHNLSKCYLFTLAALIYLKENNNPLEIQSFLNIIMRQLDYISVPIASYFARYFVYTNILNNFKEHVSLDFFLNVISRMTDVYRRMIIENNNSIEVRTVEFILQTILNNLNTSISYSSAEGDSLNKTIETIFQCIYDEKTGIFLEFVLEWFCKGLSEEKAIFAISSILAGLAKLTENDEHMGERLNNILERILTYYNSLIDSQRAVLTKIISDNFEEKIFSKLAAIIKGAKDFNAKDSKCPEIKQIFDFTLSTIKFILINEDPKHNNSKYCNEIFRIVGRYIPNIPSKAKTEKTEGTSVSTGDNEKKKKYSDEIFHPFNEICRLLQHKKISIFSLSNFVDIIKNKNIDYKRKFYMKLIKNVTEVKEEIDQIDKVNMVFKLLIFSIIKERELIIKDNKDRSYSVSRMKPSLSFRHSTACAISELINYKDKDEKEEQDLIINCIKLTHNESVDMHLQIIFMIKTLLFENTKDKNYMRESWSYFINYLQEFVSNILILAAKKANKSIVTNPTKKYDLSSYDNTEILMRITNIYEIIRDLINKDFMFCQKENLESILSIVSNIDKNQYLYNETNRDTMKKICLKFIKLYLKLISVFSETAVEINDLIDASGDGIDMAPKPNKIKIRSLKQFILTLKDFTFFNRKEYISIIDEIRKTSETFQFRVETIKILIHSCDLYYNGNIKEIERIKKNLTKAREQSEFAMAEINNLVLFFKIIKKYLYFLKEGEKDIITKEELKQLFDFVEENKDNYLEYFKNNPRETDKFKEKLMKLNELKKDAEKNNFI